MVIDLSAKYSFEELQAKCKGSCPACNRTVRYRLDRWHTAFSTYYYDTIKCNSCDFQIAFEPGYNKWEDVGKSTKITKVEWAGFSMLWHWNFVGLYGVDIPRVIRLQSSPIVDLPDTIKKIALLS